MRVYIDSDILIWHLRGEAKAAALLRRLSVEPGTELWVGALQRAEVVFFMRPREVTATRAFLSRFKTEAVTQAMQTVKAAGKCPGFTTNTAEDIKEAVRLGGQYLTTAITRVIQSGSGPYLSAMKANR